ncbi:hypothetical protein DFH09DRAFT_1079395 [Mycena vulgaris]|nr:hypothetical protein DFH09DRAFT_1079395 [Mycena vulgaris]
MGHDGPSKGRRSSVYDPLIGEPELIRIRADHVAEHGAEWGGARARPGAGAERIGATGRRGGAAFAVAYSIRRTLPPHGLHTYLRPTAHAPPPLAPPPLLPVRRPRRCAPRLALQRRTRPIAATLDTTVTPRILHKDGFPAVEPRSLSESASAITLQEIKRCASLRYLAVSLILGSIARAASSSDCHLRPNLHATNLGRRRASSAYRGLLCRKNRAKPIRTDKTLSGHNGWPALSEPDKMEVAR